MAGLRTYRAHHIAPSAAARAQHQAYRIWQHHGIGVVALAASISALSLLFSLAARQRQCDDGIILRHNLIIMYDDSDDVVA